jgi:hypothetical protein
VRSPSKCEKYFLLSSISDAVVQRILSPSSCFLFHRL